MLERYQVFVIFARAILLHYWDWSLKNGKYKTEYSDVFSMYAASTYSPALQQNYENNCYHVEISL